MFAPEKAPVRFKYNMLWLSASSLDDTIGGWYSRGWMLLHGSLMLRLRSALCFINHEEYRQMFHWISGLVVVIVVLAMLRARR